MTPGDGRPTTVRPVAAIVTGLVLAACSGQGSVPVGTTVHILATWGTTQHDALNAVLRPWEARTGNTVSFVATRDVDFALKEALSRGAPPDLVTLPSETLLRAHVAAGNLIDLDGMLDASALERDYGTAFLSLGMVGGRLYGVMVPNSLEGLIWYDPNAAQAAGFTNDLQPPPMSWSAVVSLAGRMQAAGTTPWCVGLEGGLASGWPGADWIGDFLLRTAGPAAYADLARGRLAWASASVRRAWTMWGDVVNRPGMVHGGLTGMLQTNFSEAADPLFDAPPGCYLYHQSSTIATAVKPDGAPVRPGLDLAFFGFPTIDPKFDGAEVVTGDLLAMVRRSAAARDLLSYLTTAAAQTIWIEQGGGLSANRQVALSAYPEIFARDEAAILTKAPIAVSDASGEMPQAMVDAFRQGVLEFVAHPDQLGGILAHLDTVQRTAY